MYGQGSGPIWLTHVHCTGDEPALQACAHEGWNTSYSRMPQTWRLEVTPSAVGPTTFLRRSSNCSSHQYDASVYCFGKGQYTLVKQIFVEFYWGSRKPDTTNPSNQPILPSSAVVKKCWGFFSENREIYKA